MFIIILGHYLPVSLLTFTLMVDKEMRNMQKKSVEFLKAEGHPGNSLNNVHNSHRLIKMQNLGK